MPEECSSHEERCLCMANTMEIMESSSRKWDTPVVVPAQSCRHATLTIAAVYMNLHTYQPCLLNSVVHRCHVVMARAESHRDKITCVVSERQVPPVNISAVFVATPFMANGDGAWRCGGQVRTYGQSPTTHADNEGASTTAPSTRSCWLPSYDTVRTTVGRSSGGGRPCGTVSPLAES